MEGVPLKRLKLEQSDKDFDITKCIFCQTVTNETVSSTENGQKWVIEAAKIWNDKVAQMLESIDITKFVYHVSNICYKKYTLKKKLDAIVNQQRNPIY